MVAVLGEKSRDPTVSDANTDKPDTSVCDTSHRGVKRGRSWKVHEMEGGHLEKVPFLGEREMCLRDLMVK